MSDLRKLLTISCLLLVFACQMGYYFFYVGERAAAQHEMKAAMLAGLPDESYQIIVLEKNSNAIFWEEEGKEFYLNGKLYDVAKSSVKDGATYLYCLEDSGEDAIIKNLANNAQTGNEASSNGKGSRHQFKFQLTDLINHELLPITSDGGTAGSYFAEYSDRLISSLLAVNKMPPRA